MKLYHATPIENADSINEIGLCPVSTDSPSRLVGSGYDTLQGTGLVGIYGWVSLDDAQRFAREECGGYGVVYEFEASEAIDDPEFDGAKFALTDQPIQATLVWDQYEN